MGNRGWLCGGLRLGSTPHVPFHPYHSHTHSYTHCTLMVATPTVLPRPPLFPTLMPRPQQPYPTPLAIPGRRVGKLIMRRDLVQEMDDLSDEEAELEDTVRQHHVV
jgi:hypothetical protein